MDSKNPPPLLARLLTCDFECGEVNTHFCIEWDAFLCDTCCDLQNKDITLPDCPRYDDGRKVDADA